MDLVINDEVMVINDEDLVIKNVEVVINEDLVINDEDLFINDEDLVINEIITNSVVIDDMVKVVTNEEVVAISVVVLKYEVIIYVVGVGYVMVTCEVKVTEAINLEVNNIVVIVSVFRGSRNARLNQVEMKVVVSLKVVGSFCYL